MGKVKQMLLDEQEMIDMVSDFDFSGGHLLDQHESAATEEESVLAKHLSFIRGNLTTVQGQPANMKGVKGGNCNRTACQKTGAWYEHKDIHAYYCLDCAWDIQEFAVRVDGISLFKDLEKYGLAPTITR